MMQDIVLRPNIVQSLVTQQINFWVGNSTDGSTSGLHHDFHDNVYVLLRGRKKYVCSITNAIYNVFTTVYCMC